LIRTCYVQDRFGASSPAESSSMVEALARQSRAPKRAAPPPAPLSPVPAPQAAGQPMTKKQKQQQQQQQQGAAKRKPWTVVEEAALANGVKKHGQGQWRLILNDPLFKADVSTIFTLLFSSFVVHSVLRCCLSFLL
jgi:hypothetical protein